MKTIQNNNPYGRRVLARGFVRLTETNGEWSTLSPFHNCKEEFLRRYRPASGAPFLFGVTVPRRAYVRSFINKCERILGLEERTEIENVRLSGAQARYGRRRRTQPTLNQVMVTPAPFWRSMPHMSLFCILLRCGMSFTNYRSNNSFLTALRSEPHARQTFDAIALFLSKGGLNRRGLARARSGWVFGFSPMVGNVRPMGQLFANGRPNLKVDFLKNPMYHIHAKEI